MWPLALYPVSWSIPLSQWHLKNDSSLIALLLLSYSAMAALASRKPALCRVKVKISWNLTLVYFFYVCFQTLPVWSHFMTGAVVIGTVLNNSEIEFGESLNWFLCGLIVPAVKIIRHLEKMFPNFGDAIHEIHSSEICLSSASLKTQAVFWSRAMFDRILYFWKKLSTQICFDTGLKYGYVLNFFGL